MKNKNLIFGISIFVLIIILIIILTRKSNCNGEGFSKKKSNLLAPKKPGEECSKDEECKVQCTDGHCICTGNFGSPYKDASCPEDNPICHDFKCQAQKQNNGESCERDDVCKSGHCVGNKCTECAGDGNCKDWQYCSSKSTCENKRDKDISCNSDKQCKSNKCNCECSSSCYPFVDWDECCFYSCQGDYNLS